MSEDAEFARLRKALEAEFEEFVSTAAHNLREPLREVASFSQLMAENYASRLNGEPGIFLGRIQEGAAKMNSLLADMVSYTTVGTDDRQLRSTNMEAVLGQALLCAEKQLAERSAVVTHDPLPAVTGDFAILTKLLHHLIRNAIEYCDTSPPSVHISCRQAASEWIFSVKDNGPGIEPAFQDRIFRVFKRLHGKEYPGNGLGLAFCKRAIEGLGGRMWIESTPGEGATFYFTLAPVD